MVTIGLMPSYAARSPVTVNTAIAKAAPAASVATRVNVGVSTPAPPQSSVLPRTPSGVNPISLQPYAGVMATYSGAQADVTPSNAPAGVSVMPSALANAAIPPAPTGQPSAPAMVTSAIPVQSVPGQATPAGARFAASAPAPAPSSPTPSGASNPATVLHLEAGAAAAAVVLVGAVAGYLVSRTKKGAAIGAGAGLLVDAAAAAYYVSGIRK